MGKKRSHDRILKIKNRHYRKMRILTLLLFLMHFKLTMDLFKLDGKEIKFKFNSIKTSSFLYKKTNNRETYLLIDFFFDIIYFFKKGRYRLTLIFLFSILFLIFSFFSFFFIIQYFLCLIYLTFKIILLILIKKDCVICLKTYDIDKSCILNILNSPFF